MKELELIKRKAVQIFSVEELEVITRLRKMGLSDYDISSTLATSISQRLVRRLCLELIKRKAVQIFSVEELEEKIKSGKKLKIKLGADPSM